MLIEKEDAIKAICEACYMYKYIGEHYKDCKYYPCDDINALEAVPEAPSGDMISRADAIEAVIEYWDGYAKPLDSWDVMNRTRAVLEALPSAEAVQIPIKLEKRYPESKDEDITDAFMRGYLAGRSSAEAVQGYTEWLEKIIVMLEPEYLCEDTTDKEWCDENCKYDSIQAECLRHLYEVDNGGADAEAVQGWIPCSERLPLVSGEFLVTLVDNDGTWVSTAQWNTTFGGRWQDIFPNDGYRDISNVIAWKTLPTPYTKEDNE